MRSSCFREAGRFGRLKALSLSRGYSRAEAKRSPLAHTRSYGKECSFKKGLPRDREVMKQLLCRRDTGYGFHP